MADVTYIRVTTSAGVASGETGTWIPVSELDLTTMNTGANTNAAGSLTFTLAGDDAIVSTLTQRIDNGTGFTIEVATYDNTTASSTSAGTLLSYATSTNALGTSQSTSGTTNANSFALTLSNISQTTYPPGGTASQSAFSYRNNAAVAPTAVPANVRSGASVAASTSTAPAPSDLSYFARFASANGTYLQNINGGTWFAVSGVSAGVTNPAGNGKPNLSMLDLTVTDQAVLPTFFTDSATGKSLYGVQVEAVTSSGYVADNTTYETAAIASFGSGGQIGVTYGAEYAQHFTGSGAVSASSYSSGSTNPSTSMIAATTPTNVSAGQPTNSYFFAIDGFTGDTAAPTDAKSKTLLGNDTTGFVATNGAFSVSTRSSASGQAAAVSSVSLTSSSQALGLHLDSQLLTGKYDSGARLVDYSNGTATGSDGLTEITPSSDSLDLVSGTHDYALNFHSIAVQSFGNGQGTTTNTDIYDTSSTTSSAVARAYVAPQAQTSSTAPTQDADAAPSAAQPETVRSDAAVAAAAPANTSYIQFRDANGAVVSSSTGQTWFSVSAATSGFSHSIDTSTPVLADLDFTIGQDAITGTLDTNLVAGTKLTAELATYGGQNDALQSDYVFGQSTVDSHSISSNPSVQEFAFAPTTFQEAQYSSSGSMTGLVTYDTSTGVAGSTAIVRPNAPAAAPPATNNAPPQALSTYVQFVDSNGVALANSSGSSFVKITNASSGLAGANAQDFGSLQLSVGDDQVSSQLDAAFFSGATLNSVNVVTHDANGNVVSSQSYAAATVAADNVANTGGDHAYSFNYTGYGESIAGTNLLNGSAATAGTTSTAPSLLTAMTANVGAATPPSLSTLAFYGELKVQSTQAEIFSGSSSGFIALPDVSINLAASTASVEVDQTQAAALASALDGNTRAQFEIAGYNSAGRSIDYVLSGVSLTSNSADTATGLDSVTLAYTSLQETKAGSSTVNEGPAGAQTVDAPTTAPCYVTGTLIRTARGDVPVENLRVGDIAITTSGVYRPIRWIGSRLTHPRRYPRPHETMPVRISAHAFGNNRPARDLLVSPGHSLCVDVVGEVLIPAVALINGITIIQEDVDHVTYWHVELEGGHEIIMAENMPCESYLDMGNRAFFAENGVVSLDATPNVPVVTHADFCRPFHADGAIVDVVRAQLAARATRLGWRLEEQGLGDLHLLVDGVRIEPRARGLSARFILPEGAKDVWLVSSTTVPADIAASPDRRSLGLSIAALTLDDGFGAPCDVALDDPRLCVGFHNVERDGDAAWRWTAGRARLPASLWEGMDDDFFLRIDFASLALPRWVASTREADDKRRPLALLA